jgi:hypothetical protein
MGKAEGAVSWAVVSLVMMVSAVLSTSSLVYHDDDTDTLTLGGLLFYSGLAIFLASFLGPLIVMLVGLGWRMLPFQRSEPTAESPTVPRHHALN